jgi:hypothetical protein
MTKKKYFFGKMILKKFEEIFTTNDPKKIITILWKPNWCCYIDMNYRIGFEDGREGIHYKEIKPIPKQLYY